MKKSLVALAVLSAFSGVVSAQSNVTIYGIVDVGYEYSRPKDNATLTYNPLGTNTDRANSLSQISSGIQSGSRLGFRGTEGLGNGLNAIFTLEAGFSPDTGLSAQGGRLFGRQAFAGLQGGFGTVALGRFAALSSGTGSFDMWGQVDPFGTGFPYAGTQNTFSSSNALRLDNTVAYVSPTWAGFKFGAMYSFNSAGAESATPVAIAPTTGVATGGNIKVADFGVSYGIGPLYAVVTYDTFQYPGAANDETHLQAGLTWDFKFLKLHGGYGRERGLRDGFNPQGYTALAPNLRATAEGSDADEWMGGVTVPLAGGSILASYQNRNGKPFTYTPSTAATAVTREGDRRVWSAGYTYPLSRRTNLYAVYSDSNSSKSLNQYFGTDRSTVYAGVRHQF